MKFGHQVKLDGAKPASIKHRAMSFMAQYRFMPQGTVQRFIGVGYGSVSLGDERPAGPIAGTPVDAANGDGFVGRLGVDLSPAPTC